MSFELLPLLRALTDGGVEFVVIGGVAVSLHGPIRATEDLDIVPRAGADNLMALGNVIASLNGRLVRDPLTPFGPQHRAALAQGRSVSISTDLGDVDVVQRLPGVPAFDQLLRAAEAVQLDGMQVHFASRSDLVAMKRARGSAQDLADLDALDAG